MKNMKNIVESTALLLILSFCGFGQPAPPVNPPSGGGGSGTVTHTAGALAASVVVIGNNGADIKTPSNAPTVDSSGNLAVTGTISSGAGSGLAGGYAFYDTAGIKNYAWFSPTTITGSGCKLVMPAGDPANQVLQFAAPSSGICAATWVTAGGSSARSSNFLGGGFPTYAAGTAGPACADSGCGANIGQSFLFSAKSTVINNIVLTIKGAGAAGTGIIVGIWVPGGSPLIPTTLVCSAVTTDTTATTTITIPITGCTNITLNQDYFFTWSSDSSVIRTTAAGDGTSTQMMGALNAAYAGSYPAMSSGAGGSLTWNNPFTGTFTTLQGSNAQATSFPIVYLGGN